MQVDTGQFLSLKAAAEAVAASGDMRPVPYEVLKSYHQGFTDGRDRLRNEYGLPEVPRIGTADDRWIASYAASEEAVIRAAFDAGLAAASDPVPAVSHGAGRHAAPRRERQRPGWLRMVRGSAS